MSRVVPAEIKRSPARGFARETEGDLFLLSKGIAFHLVHGGDRFSTPYFWATFAAQADLETSVGLEEAENRPEEGR